MKEVRQTTFGAKEGNCLEACIASLLEIDISYVPTIGDNKDWFDFINDWLIKEFGLYLVAMEVRHYFTPKGYHLIWGVSPRYKDVDHSVVGLDGKIVFDPHPSNKGLVDKREYVVLAKLLS